MKKLIKRIGVTFIAFLFVLNSLSLPGISSVLADESALQKAAVRVEESTGGTSTAYQQPLVDEPVNEEPAAAGEETNGPGYQEDTQAVSAETEPDAEIVDIPASEIAPSVDEITEDGSEAVETLNSEEEQSVSEGEEQADETLNDDVTDDQKNTEITEESMPAMTFEDYVEDIYVKVEAEEKTFPEGTWMKVVYVEAWKIIDSVDKAVEGEVEDVKAVDITFYDKDGKEIQPEKPVSVKLQIAGMEEAADQAVFHVDNEGKVDVLTEATVEEDIASFDAEKFSTYGVALKAAAAEEDAEPVRGDGEEETEEGEGTEETWTVTFYDRDGDLYETVKVVKGEAIGTKLPETIAREDYVAYWAIGQINEGEQGTEIEVTGNRIDAEFVPEDDVTIVPDYAKITSSVADELKAEIIEARPQILGVAA